MDQNSLVTSQCYRKRYYYSSTNAYSGPAHTMASDFCFITGKRSEGYMTFILIYMCIINNVSNKDGCVR